MGGGEAGSFYNLECFARATEFGPAILDFQLPTVFFNARNVRAGSPGWSPVSVKTRRSMNYPRDMGEAYHSFSYFEKNPKSHRRELFLPYSPIHSPPSSMPFNRNR